MTQRIITIFICALLWLPLRAMSSETSHAGHQASSPHAGHQSGASYTGQQNRTIKALSQQDIDDLRQGRGWGLAKAAELNGLPGPIHLLDLREEISLSPQQVTAIKQAFHLMKQKAIPLGERLIALEAQLEHAFVSRKIDDPTLKSLLAQIATVRADLRYVHLAAHLKTPTLLSSDQVDLYNQLRGYKTR